VTPATGRGRGRQESPVIVLGGARSGTSLLYKALCIHSQAAWISNWVARYPWAPALSILNRGAMRMASTQRAVWFGGGGEAYVYGKKRRWSERVFPMPVEGDRVYRRCGTPEHVDVVEAARLDPTIARLRSAFRTIRSFSGGELLVTKRIANNFRIPLLLAAFPEARFVDITRDGRAVAYSLSRVDWWLDSQIWWAGTTPRQWAASGCDGWELCARNWVEEVRAIRRGLESVPADQVMSLRYEELTDDPVAVLQAVARFAGFATSREWERRLLDLRFDGRNDSWRRALAGKDIEVIERVQGDELRRLQYVS
jgi:omega-hydroxy-beta-dihydromenaquinone-9 sulfotransferase